MSEGFGPPNVIATLDAWRAQGADALDPVRFRVIEAMHRRAMAYDGVTRRALDARIARLIDAYANDLASHVKPGAPVSKPVRGALAELADRIADNKDASLAYPEMEALDYFRQTWNTLSTERQFRQSLAQVPGNAGPLNSSSLVHRSLMLMRELSPGYLQQFLSYADALSRLEHMNGAITATGDKDAARAGPARKSGRSKTR